MTDPTAPPALEDFEAITLPSLPDVARYALSLTRDQADADDLVQETYLRAFRGWHTFRPGSDARAWLTAIARNTWLRQRQRAAREVATESPELETLAAVQQHVEARDAGLDQVFTQPDVGPAIAAAIAALPDAFRDVVQLVDVQDLAYEQAAEILEVPIGTVRSRLFRARRLLQQALLDHARDAGFATARRTPEDP